MKDTARSSYHIKHWRGPDNRYYWQYLKLVQLHDITKIYQEFGSGIWNFVKLCKEAKAAKMGVSQVVNLLKIATNQLSSVQYRYQTLQEHNNKFESILKTKSRELQYINRLVNLDQINLGTLFVSLSI